MSEILYLKNRNWPFESLFWIKQKISEALFIKLLNPSQDVKYAFVKCVQPKTFLQILDLEKVNLHRSHQKSRF